MTKWLLVETFGSVPPTVIGMGGSPRSMTPLTKALNQGGSLREVESAIANVKETKLPLDVVSKNRRVVAVPLISYRGDVHGIHVWSGQLGETPPPRDTAGAWYFNLTTDVIGGSDELLDLYGVPADKRQHARVTAEAFTRLLANVDFAAGLAKLVRSEPGEEHQAIWTVIRDDGARRAAHFSFRAVAETNTLGKQEVVLRGITHDLGPAETSPAAPPPIVLEQRLLESMAEPGQHRAIVNLKTFRILRWLDEPMQDLGWEMDERNPLPWIHDDDLPLARSLASTLGKATKATATLRFRGRDASWLPLVVVANLVLLDEHTTAALFTLTLP